MQEKRNLFQKQLTHCINTLIIIPKQFKRLTHPRTLQKFIINLLKQIAIVFLLLLKPREVMLLVTQTFQKAREEGEKKKNNRTHSIYYFIKYAVH